MPWKLVAADYSQIELRILAHLSQSRPMLNVYRQDGDIHVATASEKFGVPEIAVTKLMRTLAKTANFGVPYGLTPPGLLVQMRKDAMNDELPDEVRRYLRSQTLEDCTAFMEAFFRRYSGVQEYMESMRLFVRRHGYAETLFGRRRWIPDAQSEDQRTREHGEKAGINVPIQGTAADAMKKAMILVQRGRDSLGLQARLLLQVHDELIVGCPDEEVSVVIQLLQTEMPKPFVEIEMEIPTPVSARVGETWGGLKEVA